MWELAQSAEVTVQAGGVSHASVCSFMLWIWGCCPLTISDFASEIDNCYIVKEEGKEVEWSWYILLRKAQGNLKESIYMVRKGFKIQTYNLSI